MDGREKAILVGLTAGTMCDRPQLAYLFDLATQAPVGIGVECGVARGGSLICWSSARIKRGAVIGVDTMVPNRWDNGLRENLIKYRPDIVFLQGNSWEVGAMLSLQRKVAFCFIDACHDRAGVGRDITVWPLAIMPGGIIAFHDYSAPKCPDVKVCVDGWQKDAKWEHLGQVGSTVAFRKPS